MTDLLNEAFAKAAQLPPEEQDALAALILEEMASEKQWAEAFALSQDHLAQMAGEALMEFKEGKTMPLDEDNM
jgi:hypothetical protein